MNYRVLLLILLHMVSLNALGQYENIWVFGNHAGIDFNSGAPVPIRTGIVGDPSLRESNASVCDKQGQLLFYTEGSFVWDRNGNLMPNGSDLTLIPVSTTWPNMSVTTSSAQGSLIVPIPGNKYLYYIFSLTSVEQGVNKGRLYYSLIDMRLNGGLGDVVANEKGILLDTNLGEKMTSLKGNRCNVWLVLSSSVPAAFKCYEITRSGIEPIPVVSDVGMDRTAFALVGTLTPASNGKKLAVCQMGVDKTACIYDFDAATGLVANPLVLNVSKPGYGACFSPDDTKLYVNILSDGIYQYDLSSAVPSEILSSRTWLGQSSPQNVSHLKLAPDKKIYFGSNSGLGLIQFPDRAGTACSYIAEAIQLLDSTLMTGGLPNTVSVNLDQPDTFFSSRIIEAPCFLPPGPFRLEAGNTATGKDYTWSNGTAAKSTTVDTPGIYWVSYQLPPCDFHVDTFYLSFPNGRLPSWTVQAACREQANGGIALGTYSADTVQYTYTWSNAKGDIISNNLGLQQVEAGTYTLKIQTWQCDTVLSIRVPSEDFRVSFKADTLICSLDTLFFQNTSDTHFVNFLWTFGDQDSAQVAQPFHIFREAGQYDVTLVGSGTVCQDTLVQAITVDAKFGTRFSAVPARICVGEDIAFYPEAALTTRSIQWQFGDDRILASAKETFIHHGYTSPGAIPVILTAHFRACPDTSFMDTVYVYPFPSIDLGPDTVLCLKSIPLLLKNYTSLPTHTYHYRWNTGDTTAQIRIGHPGRYSLTVSADPLGCSTTESVKVSKDCYMDIPNTFTPNGDGTNDYFFPRQELSRNLSRFKMQVWNRWGVMVFESNNTKGRGWDGTFNGKGQPAGVYLYRIEMETTDQLMETHEGNVTLLR